MCQREKEKIESTIEILQAYLDGKDLEMKVGSKWQDTKHLKFDIGTYRIKEIQSNNLSKNLADLLKAYDDGKALKMKNKKYTGQNWYYFSTENRPTRECFIEMLKDNNNIIELDKAEYAYVPYENEIQFIKEQQKHGPCIGEFELKNIRSCTGGCMITDNRTKSEYFMSYKQLLESGAKWQDMTSCGYLKRIEK